MASGLPDYFRSIRPKYGTAKMIGGNPKVTADRVTMLKHISGKGMICGGSVFVDSGLTQKSSVLFLIIDVQSLIAYNFLGLYTFKINQPTSSRVYLLSYDDAASRYAVGISPNITFEKSFELWYHEKHDTTPVVNYIIDYTLIT